MNNKPLIGVSIYMVVLLSLGFFITTAVGYQMYILPNEKSMNHDINQKMLIHPPRFFFNKYRIFGLGDGWWINPFNVTWHSNLHETTDNYTHHTHGFYYKTNIYIVNHGGMQINRYCLFVKDKILGTIYDKTELPERFIIYNFTGFISLTFYGYPHGAHGCLFQLFGNAKDFHAYLPV